MASVSFKVFLVDDNSTEARRFVVDDVSVVTNFLLMKEKFKIIFPRLHDTAFRVTWKDSDGDEITIDSDEDLVTAFTETNGSLKVFYVTILNTEPEFVYLPGKYPAIICDVCEKHITGFRYKCVQCPDYDLCANCENKAHHPEHIMLRTSKGRFPFDNCSLKKIVDHMNKSIRKVSHMAYKEACHASKYRFKANREECKKRYQQDQQKPGPSHKMDGSDQKTGNEQAHYPSGCPMQEFGYDHITPMIYPFLDAISNAANYAATAAPAAAAAAATAAATAATTAAATAATAPMGSTTNPTGEGGNSTTNTNNNALPPPPPIINLIRNAINGFFESASQYQPQATPNSQGSETNVPPKPSAQPEVTTQTIPSQTTSGHTTPMEVEKEAQPQDFVTRDLGWTIVDNRNEQTEAEKPTAPAQSERENSKIAEGLKQLLDMGFSDELNLVALLRRFDGNVGEVVKYLFENNI